MNRTSSLVVVAAGLALAACAVSSSDAGGESEGPPRLEVAPQPVAIPGSWVPGPAVDAVADQQNVPHTGSPRVADGGRCASPNAFDCSCVHPACSGPLPGTLAFRDFLLRRFPQIDSAGGFQCCRQNTGDTDYLSVHSIGRAIDLMIPQVGGDADNTAGDEVANWLIMNAGRIGVQQVIWDRASWRGSRAAGAKMRPYDGPIPHTDHIHMELSLDGAAAATPFFTSGEVGGSGEACVPACEGAVILDEHCGRGDCAAFGQTCIADPTPRCGVPECPREGNAMVCVDANHIVTCENGLMTNFGDCGAYGSFCSAAGRAPTDAHCVLSLCVGSPDTVPTDHTGCSIRGGARLHCTADGGFSEEACAPGEVCSDLSGTGACVAPAPGCPTNFGEGLQIAPFCLGDERVVCVNGNLVGTERCESGSVCRDIGGAPTCVSSLCLDAAGATLCLDNGNPARCGANGTLEALPPCEPGAACAGGVCVPGAPPPPDAAAPLADARPGATDARVVPGGDAGPGTPPAPDDAALATDDAALQEDPDAALTWREQSNGASGGCALAPRVPVTAPLTLVLGALAGLGLRRRRPRG